MYNKNEANLADKIVQKMVGIQELTPPEKGERGCWNTAEIQFHRTSAEQTNFILKFFLLSL